MIYIAIYYKCKRKKKKKTKVILCLGQNIISVPHSVFSPQGLRLVRLTDVSLLVEWEPVSGADYYILTYHPKNDEHALQQVAHIRTSNSENCQF